MEGMELAHEDISEVLKALLADFVDAGVDVALEIVFHVSPRGPGDDFPVEGSFCEAGTTEDEGGPEGVIDAAN